MREWQLALMSQRVYNKIQYTFQNNGSVIISTRGPFCWRCDDPTNFLNMHNSKVKKLLKNSLLSVDIFGMFLVRSNIGIIAIEFFNNHLIIIWQHSIKKRSWEKQDFVFGFSGDPFNRLPCSFLSFHTGICDHCSFFCSFEHLSIYSALRYN